MKKIPYDELPLLVSFMGYHVATDAGLNREQAERFGNICESRTRAAYEAEGDNYFKKCIRTGNRGRDTMLQTWLPHWLESFKLNPDRFEQIGIDTFGRIKV